MANAAEFSIDIQKFADRVELDIRDVRRKITLDLFAEVSKRFVLAIRAVACLRFSSPVPTPVGGEFFRRPMWTLWRVRTRFLSNVFRMGPFTVQRGRLENGSLPTNSRKICV